MNLFSIWLKELKSFFPIWLKELKSFFQCDSKNWIFSKCSRNWISLPYELLFYMTRIELFFDQYDSKSKIFSQKMTQSVEHLFEFDWKSWTLFALDSKNWTFFQYVSMNWTFFLNMTHRIEPFFNMFARILNFSKNMTHWIEPFFCKKNDSKNVLKVKKWLNELNLLVIRLTELKLRLDT